QWTVLDRDRTTGLKRESVDTALEQLCWRRTLEAPKCFAAVLVLDVQVEPRMRVVEGPPHDRTGRNLLNAFVEHSERMVRAGDGRRQQQCDQYGGKQTEGLFHLPTPYLGLRPIGLALRVYSAAWC